MLGREAKEAQLSQRGHVFWLYGLSGSGKSTLAIAFERALAEAGIFTKLLDGDNIRSRLNHDLGFSDGDRAENIRRIAEVARLFVESGVVVFASFITPTRALRETATDIIGADDCTRIHIKASFETCAARDVKGLYAKAEAGSVKDFTGKDSSFELPAKDDSDWEIDTEHLSEAEAVKNLLDQILPKIKVVILLFIILK